MYVSKHRAYLVFVTLAVLGVIGTLIALYHGERVIALWVGGCTLLGVIIKAAVNFKERLDADPESLPKRKMKKAVRR